MLSWVVFLFHLVSAEVTHWCPAGMVLCLGGDGWKAVFSWTLVASQVSQDSLTSYMQLIVPTEVFQEIQVKLQGFLRPILRSRKHHFCHILLISQVPKARSDSRGKEPDVTSQ